MIIGDLLGWSLTTLAPTIDKCVAYKHTLMHANYSYTDLMTALKVSLNNPCR